MGGRKTRNIKGGGMLDFFLGSTTNPALTQGASVGSEQSNNIINGIRSPMSSDVMNQYPQTLYHQYNRPLV